MSNFLDTSKIIGILKDYYTVTHIRIAILNNDYKDIAGYPDKRAALCEYIRTSKIANKHCEECDEKACSIARNCGSAYMYKCHAGLYEIIRPLYVNGLIVGFLFFAHMLSGESKEYCLNDILSRTKNFNLDDNKIKELVNNSALLNYDYIKAASRLLETIATHLCLEKMGLIKEYDNLITNINRYIYDHIKENIQINDICNAVGVGKTKLCSISKEYFKTGIHEHIRQIKIDKAKEILINEPEVSIDDVVQRCGFSDYNYFIYIFRNIVGITPKKFIKINEVKETDSLTSLE